MNPNNTVTISHIGICTSDIDRSVQFYVGALGFVLKHSIDEIGPPYDTLTGLPGVKCCAHHLQCGEVTIELLGFPAGDFIGPAGRRPMNQLGFTHMTLVVDDVDAIADRVVQYGGHVHPETRIESPLGPMVFCTDPDGVRIELIQRTA